MRIKIDELTRLAFYWAEQDRLGLADAWGDSPEGKEALAYARLLHNYRVKRWGKSRRDLLDEIPSQQMDVSKLLKTK